MLLNEPPRSQGDLNFSLLGIPVRVHPMFWVMGLILGSTGSGNDVRPLIVWVVAVFVSVLVHELGHALVMRALGVQPWITLYGMGGLTSNRGNRFPPATQILVSAAGPAAGFGLAGLVILVLMMSGHFRGVHVGLPEVIHVRYTPFGNDMTDDLVRAALFINIWWGILNLLPILPLDGGQITYQALNLVNPARALWITLVVSLVVASVMALSGLRGGTHPNWFRIVLFGSLAYGSYQMLTAYSGTRR